MNFKILLPCVVIFIIVFSWLLYDKLYQYSYFNTKTKKVCNKKTCLFFNVHDSYDNSEEAAKLLSEIYNRIIKLSEHIEKKNDSECKECIRDGLRIYDIKYGLQKIKENFKPNNIYENSPHNFIGSTSYTENKKLILLCLRNKDGKLHDINTLMFVALHELAHVMNRSWGHNLEFWKIFKFLLQQAEDINIYYPVNYETQPTVYCGEVIKNNPYFINFS